MSNPVDVRVYDIVGGPLCVSVEDGQRVYEKILPLLRAGQKVSLSFERVETLISAFLNAAIGQLYGEFTEERIRELLTVRDMDAEDLAILKRVVGIAKAYFSNPKAFTDAWREEMGDAEE